MIEAVNLTKKFDDIIAVDHINASIKDGLVFGLIGTNGAGKSTFLRMACGVLKPDEGQITIDGVPVYEKESVKDVYKRQMLLAQNALRDGLKAKVETVLASEKSSEEIKAACQEWLDTFSCGATNGTATDKLVAALDGIDCDICKDIVKNKDFLAKKSQWV